MIRKVALIALACIALTACATQGTVVATGTRRPPTPVDMVRVFATPPAHYEVVGIVQASSHQGWTQQSSLEYAMAELKKDAAQLGANGVLIQQTGSEYAGRYGPGMVRMAATIHAQAIYVTDQH